MIEERIEKYSNLQLVLSQIGAYKKCKNKYKIGDCFCAIGAGLDILIKNGRLKAEWINDRLSIDFPAFTFISATGISREQANRLSTLNDYTELSIPEIYEQALYE